MNAILFQSPYKIQRIDDVLNFTIERNDAFVSDLEKFCVKHGL